MERMVYEEFYPKIYNYIYYKVLRREAAEDLTSEVFYKALANEGSFDPRRAAYSTWLFTIARNCVTDYFRRRREDEPLDENLEAEGDAVDDGLNSNEELQRLCELLPLLSEREREVLALRFWGGFSYREISRQTGLSESNAGTIVNRAVRKLRELW